MDTRASRFVGKDPSIELYSNLEDFLGYHLTHPEHLKTLSEAVGACGSCTATSTGGGGGVSLWHSELRLSPPSPPSMPARDPPGTHRLAEVDLDQAGEGVALDEWLAQVEVAVLVHAPHPLLVDLFPAALEELHHLVVLLVHQLGLHAGHDPGLEADRAVRFHPLGGCQLRALKQAAGYLPPRTTE